MAHAKVTEITITVYPHAADYDETARVDFHVNFEEGERSARVPYDRLRKLVPWLPAEFAPEVMAFSVMVRMLLYIEYNTSSPHIRKIRRPAYSN